MTSTFVWVGVDCGLRQFGFIRAWILDLIGRLCSRIAARVQQGRQVCSDDAVHLKPVPVGLF